MGWVTLTLRKQTLKSSINTAEFQDIQLSRKLRATQRHLSYDQSIYNADKSQELKDAKSAYTNIKNQRPSVDSTEYEQWKVDYANAQEEYNAQKQDIEDYYDGIMSELEDEAATEENRVQEEQTSLEAQLQAMNAELETVSEQISSDIDAQKIKLS